MKQSNKTKITILLIILIFSAGILVSAETIEDTTDWNQGEFQGTSAERNDGSGNLGIGYQDGETGDKLVGFWRFDEEATDYSGEQNDGELQGTPSTENGILGTDSLSFDGEEDHITVPHDSTLEMSDNDEVAVSAWINLDEDVTDQDWTAILQKSDESYNLQLDSGIPSFTIYDGDWYSADGNEEVPVDEWVHLAATFDGDEIQLYVDGEPVATNEQPDAISEASDFDIGIAENIDNEGRHFPGQLDEIRLYEESIEEEKIEQLYFNGLDNTFEGDYTSETIGEEGLTNEWNTITINSQDFTSTDATLTFNTIQDGQIQEQQDIEIEDYDEETINLDLEPTEQAEIIIDGTTTEIENTWIVEDIEIDTEVQENINLEIETQPEDTPVGTPIEGPPQVRVEDEDGEPVEGVEVEVEKTGSGTIDSGSTSQLSDEEGIATFDDLIIEDEKDQIELTFTSGEEEINSEPFELINEYFWTAEQHEIGEQPDQWTPQVGVEDYGIAEDSEGRRYMYIEGEQTDQTFLEFNPPAEAQDWDIYTQWLPRQDEAVYARGQQIQDEPNAYRGDFISGDLRTSYYDQGEFNEIETEENPAEDPIFNMRFRIEEDNPTNILQRAWDTQDSEPSEWVLENTNDDITGEGNQGIFHWDDDGQEFRVYEYAVSSTDEAPKEPIRNDIVLRQPEQDQTFIENEEIPFEYVVQAQEFGESELIINGEVEQDDLIDSGVNILNHEQSLEPGDYEWNVEFEDGDENIEVSETRNFEVEQELNAEIELLQPEQDEEFAGTQEIEFKYEIDTNQIGDATLYLDDEEIDETRVSAGTTNITVQEEIEPGNYEWNVEFETEEQNEISQTREFEVLEIFFDVEITDTNSPIEPGETLTVDVDVENLGDEEDQQEIDLVFEGSTSSETTEVLGPGETDSITLTTDDTDLEEDVYIATVLSGQDDDSTEVQISETFADETICGEEHALTPEDNDGSRFNEIVIDGQITVCSDGATIEANDLVQVEGEITSETDESGNAPELDIISDEVIINDLVDMSGEDGEDGQTGQEDGEDGGDGGTINITSREEQLTVSDELNVEGGDGGDAGGGRAFPGDGGDGGTIILNYRTIDEETATYEISGGTSNGNNGVDGEIIRNHPVFTITEFNSEDVIAQGEPHQVEATIENTGDFVGNEPVEYYFDDQLRDTQETGDIEPTESTEVELTYEEVTEEVGDYLERVETSDDEAEKQITVETEEIIIRELNTNSPVTEEDNEILEAETIIENTGNFEGSQTIEFYFDQENTEGEPDQTQQSETLNPDGVESITFERDLSEETDGEYPVTVSSEDDEDSTTVVKGEDPYFEVEILNINDPVESGEQLTVEYEVENVGGETDTQTIEFLFDENLEDTEEYELESGEDTGIQEFTYDTSEDEPDHYPAEIQSDDDEETQTVFIGEEAFFQVEIIDFTEQVDQGDDIEIEVEVENTGDFEDTQDIDYFFDGLFEETTEETLDSGESVILNFEKETDDLSDGLYDNTVSSEDSTVVEEVQVGSYEIAEGDTTYEYLSIVEYEDQEADNLFNDQDNEDDGYIDATQSQLDQEKDQAVVKRGETYQITLESEPNSGSPDERPEDAAGPDREEEWSHYFSKWTDWDQDLEFDTEVQVGECIDEATAEEGCVATTQFTVPEDAPLGQTRFRTFVSGSIDGEYIQDPTTSEFEGQSHDYNVEVVDSNFQIQEIESPGVVGEEQTILVNATIENTGEAEGTQTIEYRFDEEKEEIDDTDEITLEPGETGEANFEYTVEEDEGDFQQLVETEDDSQTEMIMVEKAQYEVSNIETNSPIDEENQDLEVTATIENTGVVTEPQDIEFRFDDPEAEEQPDETREDEEIDPDTEETYTFTKDVDEEEDGEYEVRIDTDNDFDTAPVVIGTDPFFEVEITDTNDPVDFEEILEIDTRVENVGAEEDTQDLQLTMNDEVIRTEENVQLEGDQVETFEYEIDTEEELEEPDTYDTEFESEDDTATREVEVEGYERAVGETDFEFLSLVQIRQEDGELGIDNPSGDDDGYADFTESETGQKAVVQRGETYEITMESSQNDDEIYEHYFNIFVDWNQNIEFDQDPINLDNCETDGDGCQITAEFTVPEDAEIGETRLRGFLQFGDYQDNPTEDDYFGEAEDYTLEIADSEFEIIDFEMPEQAEAGDTINPEATIENIGAEEDTQTIEYIFDGETEDDEILTLESGETDTLTFEYTLSSDKEEGETFPQEITTNDDIVSQQLEIADIDAVLEVDLIEPETSQTVGVDTTFDMEAEITCTEDDCGETNALTQYNESTSEPDTEIPSTEEEPFYTEEENQRTCNQDLQQGETCTVNWEVNAIEEDSTYKVNVEANSENSGAEESQSREIKTEFILILETGFEEVDFGSGAPSGEEDFTVLEGNRNLEEVYTVSLDENSNEPDGLWMQSTPLENIEEDSTNEDEDNAIIEPEHTLFGFNDGSSQCESFEETDTTRSSSSFQQILETFEPGQTEEKCYFQEIPNAKLAGEYEGSLTLKVNATQ